MAKEEEKMEAWAVFDGLHHDHPMIICRTRDDAEAIQDANYPVRGRFYRIEVPRSVFHHDDYQIDRVRP